MYLGKKNYFIFISNLFMITGVFLGLNSLTWLMMWMSMEITLMFFIPRMILNKSMMESFSSLKYFIFQCMGSIFFIMGSMDFFLLNTFGLFLKLGLFPNHFWMLMVSKGLNWLIFFLLMTIQKILPLMFLIFSIQFFLLFFLLFFNSLIGNLGSLNQMDLRFLLVFSSMNHMTWMILSSNLNYFFLVIYILLYMFMFYFMYLYFYKLNIYYIFQIFLKKNLNLNFYIFFLCLLFLSFLGFPPLIGFYMKLISIFSSMYLFMFMFMMILILQNLIISYSYMRVFIFLLMNLSRSIILSKFFFKKNFYIYFIMLLFYFI